MKKRTRRFTAQWTKAAKYLAQKLGDIQRDQKQVCYSFRECLGNVLTALGFQVGVGLQVGKGHQVGMELQVGKGHQVELQVGVDLQVGMELHVGVAMRVQVDIVPDEPVVPNRYRV